MQVDSYMDSLQSLLMLSDAAFAKQQSTINTIVKSTVARLLLRLKGRVEDVPAELGFIVLEVSVKRYNRLNNEGMTSYGQEGESISYSTADSDFDEFSADIDSWLADNGGSTATVKFLNGWGHNE